MNRRMLLLTLGWLSAALALALLLPAAAALLFGDPRWMRYLLALPLPAAAGVALVLRHRSCEDRRLGRRDLFFLVGAGWAVATLAGAQPYLIAEGPGFWIDALFESASGFSTTGATVFALPEAEPAPLLLWRAMTQWIGGLGTLLLVLVVLPRLAVGGMELLAPEAPGGLQQRLAPQLAATARTLGGVYALFTLGGGLALGLAGMGPFDALCHALSGISTGGFSTRSGSIGSWDSAAVEGVMGVLMLAGAIGFTLHARALRGRLAALPRHPELRAFALIWLAVVVLLTLNLIGRAQTGLPRALREGAFQATSFITTSGFHTTDYDALSPFARTLLFAALFVGGCAGSTAGSIKVMRVVIVSKKVVADLVRLLHPHAVVPVQFGRRGIAEEVVGAITVYVHLFLIAFAMSGLVLALFGLDLITAFGASAACLANFGPAFGLAGPGDGYAALPAPAKLWLAALMLAGRIEIVPLLVGLLGLRRRSV